MDTTLTTGTDEAAVRGLTNAVLPFLDPEIDFDAERLIKYLRADPAAARAVRDAIDPDGLRTAADTLWTALGTAIKRSGQPLFESGSAEFQAILAAGRLLEGTPDAD